MAGSGTVTVTGDHGVHLRGTVVARGLRVYKVFPVQEGRPTPAAVGTVDLAGSRECTLRGASAI